MSQSILGDSSLEKKHHLPVIPAPESKPIKSEETPKVRGGLAPGHVIGSAVDQSKTIVYCDKCSKPLWEVFPIVQLGAYSSYQEPSKPLGHKQRIPDRVGCKPKMYECPFCGLPFPRYAEKTESMHYVTNKGIV